MKREGAIITCDLCGTEHKEKDITHVKMPVLFTTEQNEGKPVKPYLSTDYTLDLCASCLDRALTIEASGSMGLNRYEWRGAA